eukprot:gene14606-14730_t
MATSYPPATSGHKVTGQGFMPQARLALNVGVTGHRPNKLNPAAQDAIALHFQTLRADIAAEANSILQDRASHVYANATPVLRIVTALAEGADRLAVKNLQDDWVFEAILPMPREDYQLDFGPDANSLARIEFEELLGRAATITELVPSLAITGGDQQKRLASYQLLGAFLVRQVDILVAVWDGDKAEGPGGTADVIALAIEAGKPVIWINPGTTDGPRKIVSLGTTAQTHISVPMDAAVLSAMMSPVLLPPAAAKVPIGEHGHHRNEHGANHDATGNKEPSYFKTRWPKSLYLPFAYTLLRKISGAGRWSWPITYPTFENQQKSWDSFFSSTETTTSPPSSTADSHQDLRNILLPRSLWADALAWQFGMIYRSAYVSIFMLASLAVPLGLCYLFFLYSPAILDIKAGFVGVELLIVTGIILLVRRGHRADWHSQWLQTRQLSEYLRLGRHLFYMGALRDFVRLPLAGSTETMPEWYLRASFREIGLPNARLDSAYLRTILESARITEIGEQRSYNGANAKNLTKIHHTLHAKGELCFMATIAFLLTYLAAWAVDSVMLISHAHAAVSEAAISGEAEHGWFHEVLEYGIKPVVSIAAAALPALGAALSGINQQGDFEGFAERSHATESALANVDIQIGALLDDQNQPDLQHATEILMKATDIIAADVTAWRQQYSRKRLMLPA